VELPGGFGDIGAGHFALLANIRDTLLNFSQIHLLSPSATPLKMSSHGGEANRILPTWHSPIPACPGRRAGA